MGTSLIQTQVFTKKKINSAQLWTYSILRLFSVFSNQEKCYLQLTTKLKPKIIFKFNCFSFMIPNICEFTKSFLKEFLRILLKPHRKVCCNFLSILDIFVGKKLPSLVLFVLRVKIVWFCGLSLYVRDHQGFSFYILTEQLQLFWSS